MAATRSTNRTAPVRKRPKQNRDRKGAATAPIRNPQSAPAEPFKEGDVLHVSFAKGFWMGRLERDGAVVREINNTSLLVVTFSAIDAAKRRMKAERP